MLTDIDEKLLKVPMMRLNLDLIPAAVPSVRFLREADRKYLAVTINVSSRVIQSHMVRWMRCAKPGVRKPIMIRFSIQP